MLNIGRALDGVKNIAQEVGQSVQRTVSRALTDSGSDTRSRAAGQNAMPTDAQAKSAVDHLARTVAANSTASGSFYDPEFGGEVGGSDFKFFEIDGSLTSVKDLFGNRESGPGFSADLIRAEAHFLRGDVTWTSPCSYNFDLTGGRCENVTTLTATGPSAHVDAGLHNGSLEAGAGVSLASAKAETSVDLPAVGEATLEGEVGLKAEFAVSVGKETKVKLPFVSVGISF